MSRDWLLYLDDLIESAEKIQRFLAGGKFDEFSSNEMLFDAVLFNLEDYFAVDPQIVWEAATQHMPLLLEHAKVLRKRFDIG